MAILPAQPMADMLDTFVPIRLAMLEALDEIDCDLYVDDGKPTPTLYRAREIPISPDDFARLRQRGVDFLYVSARESVRMQERSREGVESALRNERVPSHIRFGLLQSAVSLEIHQAFHTINVNAAVERSLDIGQTISELLRGGETLPADLFNVVQHDYYTFTHVTNVAGYAVLLAERMGICDAGDLNAIATGALLHDLGKRMISPIILNKTERPTDSEWKIIQSHPQRGFEELHDRRELNHGQLMMVYQHHEKLDGSGYPVRIAGEDIHPWARLCAVVDIFDAMTCKRPYRQAMKVDVVLEYLSDMAQSKLDREMVACWTSIMTTGK